MKHKLIYLGFAAFFIAACVLILILFQDNAFIRGSVGDFVFVMLMYFLGRVIFKLKPENLALIVLGIAFAAEFSQYIRLLDILGLQGNRFLRIFLGATFDPMDLAAYVLGVLFAYLFDTKIIRSFVR